MSRKIIFAASIALAMVFAISAGVTATETRVGTMGGIGFYVHDNSNIFYFPGAIYTYSGQVVGELRVKNNDNAYSIGVNYPVGDFSVIGVYLNRPIPLTIPNNIADDVTLNQTTDLFYGMQMSEFDLGFKASFGADAITFDGGGGEDKESASYMALAAGLSNEKMDLGAHIEIPSAKYEPDGGTDRKWSGFGFAGAGRLFYGETNKFVPVGLINIRSTTADFGTGIGKVKYSDMNFGLGIGLNHNLNENNMLVMAIEAFGLQSAEQDSSDLDVGGGKITYGRLTMPGFYLGAESKIRKWLTGRLGAAQVYQAVSEKYKPETGSEQKLTYTESQFNVSFGLGFTFGDFSLDAAINEGLFFDGPNFISGTTEPMARRLSLTYNF